MAPRNTMQCLLDQCPRWLPSSSPLRDQLSFILTTRTQGFGEERVVRRLSASCRKRSEGEGDIGEERGEKRCRVRGKKVWLSSYIISYPFLARNRAKKVYTVFSRKPPSEIHSILREMAVNYAIIEDAWCRKQYRPGCAFYEVWDEEDPDNRDRPVFCQLLHSHIPPPFKQVFLNKTYRVLLVQ